MRSASAIWSSAIPTSQYHWPRRTFCTVSSPIGEPPVDVGEGHGPVRLEAVPLHGGSEGDAVGRFRCRGLAVAALRVASHVPFRPGEHSERSVAGAVGEEPPLDSYGRVVVYVSRHDGCDSARVPLLDPGDFVAEEESDVLLGEDGLQLLVVLIDLRRACIAFGGGTEFVEQIAQRRIFADVQTASEPYPDLGGVVASEHLPVLYEGHFYPPLPPR